MSLFYKYNKTKFFSIFIVLVSFLLLSFEGFSQKKVEFEIAVDQDSVPGISRDFVEQLFPEQKVNWFFEKSADDSTYEAKVKVNKKRYSVEFSYAGEFQDVEELMKENEVPQYVIDTIRGKLKESFQIIEFKKIQKQYLNKGDVMKVLKERNLSDAKKEVEINYEIIIFGESDAKQAYYEYLFDADGLFLKMQELEESSTDNFFY